MCESVGVSVCVCPGRRVHSHRIWGRWRVPRPWDDVPNRGTGSSRVGVPFLPGSSLPCSRDSMDRMGYIEQRVSGEVVEIMEVAFAETWKAAATRED